MGAIDPQGVASFDPRDLIGRTYIGYHETLQHTKYISCGPHGFSGEDLKKKNPFYGSFFAIIHGKQSSNPSSKNNLYSLPPT